METSLVSGKTVTQLAKDQSKLHHNDSAMIINNKSSKPRFETPDSTRDAHENIFLKRLAFLKNLLTDGNNNTGSNLNSREMQPGNNNSYGGLSSIWENKPILNYSPRRDMSRNEFQYANAELTLRESMDSKMLIRNKSLAQSYT